MTTYTELKQEILDYAETDSAVLTDTLLNGMIANSEDRIFRSVELDNFKEYELEDIIEVYKLKEVKRKLS